MIGKDTLREHFLSLQPLFKTAKNFKVIVLTPLPRYLWHRCCDNPAHLTNSEDDNFAREMGSRIRDLQIQLRNMIFMRKFKGVSVLNAVEALGIAQGPNNEEADLDRILALWGPNLSILQLRPIGFCPKRLLRKRMLCYQRRSPVPFRNRTLTSGKLETGTLGSLDPKCSLSAPTEV